jgi:nuclear receptor-binding protein
MSNKETAEVESTSPKAKPGEESEEESEVLEESPCGRWQKRREEVQQRDVPGIDCAFLAMDTEEGVEVVWNEVRISEKKSSKVQLENIKKIFDNLTELEHPNIAKFHKYWTDTSKDKPRVVFITEYMSSGSLRQFLRKTKRGNRTLKAWKRWCTQILSALSYLHSCDPPVIHGNLTTDTIFIQHNGLIKIGSVAPDTIYNHVKTYKEEAKNMHYAAPEYAVNTALTTASDIYAFGICALEMAALEMPANGETSHNVGEDVIQKALDSIEDQHQKDFITRCLEKNPTARPSAHDLLFHPVLFEVHALKLLTAHVYVKYGKGMADDVNMANFDASKMVADIRSEHFKPNHFSAPQSSILELQKFLEDVRNGVYPLTAFGTVSRTASTGRGTRTATPELVESTNKTETPEPVEIESRFVIRQSCQIHQQENSQTLQMTLLLRMDDNMNRQLTCEFTLGETPQGLASELVTHGFINTDDSPKIAELIKDAITNRVLPINNIS